MKTPAVFPFESLLSLAPLADYWRTRAAGEGPQAAYARFVLDHVEQEAPALLAPTLDRAALDAHRGALALLMDAVFPAATFDDTHAAAFTSFRAEPFYTTPAYERLMLNRPVQMLDGQHQMNEKSFSYGKALTAYSVILQRFYGRDVAFDYPLLFRTDDPQTGLQRYFKVHVDTRFVTLETRGTPPELTDEDFQRLVAEPMNLSRWQETIPPEHFRFRGFDVVTGIDVTDQEVLSSLKNTLLEPDAMATPEKIDLLQAALRALLKAPDLSMGLICLERDDLEAITAAVPVGRSLLMYDGRVPVCPGKNESAYARAFESECKPVVVPDLAQWPTPSAFEGRLLEQGFRNLILAPLRAEGTTIGMLELASPRTGAVNALNGLKLMQALPLFATALKRSLDEREDRVQAVIKEQYTAIHPSVEWRFRQAALHYIAEAQEGRQARLEPIIFPDVYPLYGLSDIRDSSTHRNLAIQEDLSEQLGLALSVLDEARGYRPLPILDVLGHRIHRAILDIESGLRSDDEVSVLEFLRHEVEPLFDHLEGFGDGVRRKVAAYRAAIDPELDMLYRRRAEYEETITRINDAISAYLDVQEQHAQQMFPHYFEKYKTDGVDHNLYVGASLQEDGHFDPLYLRNLRVWQLMTTCGIEWELRRLRPDLKVPLETTHLILVHHLPLSIRFRQDEKQFDVDGAYNIRYEIVKKRIDKARINGTSERLTQPGRIAIVYTQAREADEYRRYIGYLQEAGYLQDQVEELELEDLQGTHGLKALRVTIADERPRTEIHIRPERLADEMEEVLA